MESKCAKNVMLSHDVKHNVMNLLRVGPFSRTPGAPLQEGLFSIFFVLPQPRRTDAKSVLYSFLLSRSPSKDPISTSEDLLYRLSGLSLKQS